MSENSDRGDLPLQDSNPKWGLTIVLVFLFGIPMLGIVYNLIWN